MGVHLRYQCCARSSFHRKVDWRPEYPSLKKAGMAAWMPFYNGAGSSQYVAIAIAPLPSPSAARPSIAIGPMMASQPELRAGADARDHLW